MTDLERNLGKRWFEQVWNEGRKYSAIRIRGAFSGLHVDVAETIAEGDKICVRWLCTAKHTGSGLGITPTGAPIHVTGICILRAADGKVVEAWQNWDMLGMMEQIKGIETSATYIGASSR